MLIRTAELISTGSELLNGRTINTHAATLGGQLRSLGIQLRRDTTLVDDRAALAEAIQLAAGRCDLLIITGGLGPTEDDLTREALADGLQRDLVKHEAWLRLVRRRYRALGREMTADRERQAVIVEGAKLLTNPVGIAPGQRIDCEGGCSIFVLPGPPREFQGMLDKHVLPWLMEQDTGVWYEQIFMLVGLGESEIARRLEESGLELQSEIGYCARPGQVELRLERTEGEETLRREARALQVLFADAIFADRRMELADAVGERLLATEKTVAVAESCTSGLLGKLLTDRAGSSGYFIGGILSYCNEVKAAQLGVRRDDLERLGAVSEPVAAQMAQGVRERFGTDFGVGITGIAGPGGGSGEKPVGLVYIAVADAEQVVVERRVFAGNRDLVRERSAMAALHRLWSALG